MKVLVTGSNGLLGQAVAGYFGNHCELLALNHEQLDITKLELVREVVKSFAPKLIINCAAAARVDDCERNPELAWAINVNGPDFLSLAARESNCEIMHISTDYVFDGKKKTPYTIFDEPAPISIYGQSKLKGERAVCANLDNYFIVRVARLFGAGGRNFGSKIFDHLKTASDNRTKVKVFSYPLSQATHLHDLAERLYVIATRGSYGIYHVTNSGPIVSWHEFAQIAAQMMGLSSDLLEVVAYEELNMVAARPRYSALSCVLSDQLGFEPLRDWTQALKDMYSIWIRF